MDAEAKTRLRMWKLVAFSFLPAPLCVGLLLLLSFVRIPVEFEQFARYSGWVTMTLILAAPMSVSIIVALRVCREHPRPNLAIAAAVVVSLIFNFCFAAVIAFPIFAYE